MKPYYDDATCVIYHGDCEDVLPALTNVDLVFTSPPYNKAQRVDGNWSGPEPEAAKMRRTGYGEHSDAMSLPEYEEWQYTSLLAMWKTLSDVGAIFYNHKPRLATRDPGVPGGWWSPLTMNPCLPVRQVIIWVTGAGVNLVPTAFAPAHEWIVLFAKDDFRLRDRGASAIGDVWSVSPTRSDDHPAPFPIGLPARAIDAVSPRLVLDPFVGSGTTLLAAKHAGVRAVGIEISERYCEIAAKRLAQEVLDFGAAL